MSFGLVCIESNENLPISRIANSFSCPISEGIIPVKSLEEALSTTNEERSPISGGMEPLKLFTAETRRIK